jgi:hypothetical protein
MAHFITELNAQAGRRAANKNSYVESTGKIIRLNALKGKDKNGAEQDEDFITTADEGKLNAYKMEIKHTRQQRDMEMLMKKDLTEKILITWKELKDIRIKQNYRNTDLKLVIKKYVNLHVF